MKKLLLFAMAIIFAMQLSAQTTIIVGDTNTATTSTNIPMFCYFQNSYSQSIYPAANLEPGQITSISYYHTYTPYNNGIIKIYMKEVTDTTLTNYLPGTDFVQVFEGPINLVNGVVTYLFTAPFEYTGEGNLLVAVIRDGTDYQNNHTFKTAQGIGSSVYQRSDTQEYNINTPPTPYSPAESIVPVTMFTMIPIGAEFCYRPVNISVTNQTTDGATISWEASDESATTFGLAYKSATDEEWTVADENITDLTYTLSGLESNVEYEVKVYTVCSESNSTEISAVFTTLPSEDNFITLPFEEGFDDLENLTLWTITNPHTNKWYVGPLGQNTTNAEAGNGLYISNDEGVSNAYTNNATSVAHASVLINIEENTFYGISFDYKSVGEGTCCDYVGVRLVPFGQDLGTSNTLSHMIGRSPYGTNNEWQRVNIEVPTSTTPGAYNLVFSWRNDSGGGENPPAAIDNVSIYTMACSSDPINSSLTFVDTEDGPSISVALVDAMNTEGTYTLRYKAAASETWTEVEGLTINDFPFSISEGISYQATYNVQVGIICDDLEEVSYADQMNITIPCGALETPWTETFDANPFAGDITCWNRYTGQIPASGQIATSSLNISSSNWNYTTSISIGGQTHVAMYCNPYYTDQYYWLVTPSIDLGDGEVAKQLAFNVGLRDYNNDAPPASAPDDKFIAMVSLDNGETWDIANGLVFFDGDENTNLNFSSLTNQMVRYFYPLVNADGEPLTGAVRFAFYAESTVSNGDNRLCVDDIAVEDMVDCPAPSVATVDAASVTATTATASFTYYGTSTTWEYVVVEGEGEEADPDSGSAEEISSTDPIELTDLTPATTYTFAVRAICESGESTWTTATFSTLDEAELVPYETTFDEGTWFVNAGSNTSNAWVVGEGTGNEAPAAYISNDGSAYAATLVESATITHLWKDFDFGQTEENFELSFDWKVTGHQEGTSVSGGVAAYLVDRQPLPTSGLLNSDNIVAILVGSDQWQTERIFLGNVTGEKRLVFTALGYINQEELVAPAAIDNVSLSISPCAQVQDVDVTNPTTTTLDVVWTLTEADSYTISYRAAGSEEILTETATESPFTLTNLEPSTQYYVSVTAVCGSNEAIPSSTVVAYTLQDAVAIPYTCDFEEENHGWILKNASFANQWHVGTPSNATNGSLFISDNGTSANYNTNALSCVVAEKLFQLGATDSIRISFDLTVQGEFEDYYGWFYYAYDYLKVFFVDPETLIEPTSNTNTGYPYYEDGTGVLVGYNSDAPILAMLTGTQNISVTIENTPNALKKLVFMWVNDNTGGNQPPAIIDNVIVEPVGIETSCVRPVANSVVASNETTTSATISWTDNDESHSAWNVYYKLSSEEEYTMVSASETTIELTDLLPSSTYSVYVTTDCGDEESNPTATITFNTLCDVISDFPYFQGFEGGINCWTAEEIVPGSQLWGLTEEVYLYEDPTPVIEGTQAAWHTYDSGESSRLITPTFDLTSLTNPYISFYYALGSWLGAAESLTVQYRASTEDTWTDLGTFTTPLDQWVLDSIALPNPSATYQIAFASLGIDGYGVGLDAITVYDAEGEPGGTDPEPEPEPCDAPTALSASNITETSADITWNGTASTYEFKLNGGAAETLTTTTKTLTGLTANTAYTVEVRAVCEDAESDWVTTTFTTLEEQGGTDPEPEPCDAPTNLSANNITETSAEITWNGTASTYEIKLNGGTAETLTTTTKALTGLTPNTAYTVEVRSICENQTSEWVSANFTTLEQIVIVLGEVTTSPATNLGNTSATLNGALVSAGESENFTVGFALATTADFTLEDAGVQNITATLTDNAFSQAVNDLVEGQTYFYRAYITNEAGTAYGAVETFTLLGLTDALANQIAVSLYPNPATDNATLDINGLNQEAKIVVSDLQGRILSQDNINAGTTRYTINVSDMTSGVYYIRIITDNVVNTQKLIVE
ncbi:MAG: fibronectin type III domain-containing protein [Bacteroidales bacterium]|nr:fibronectin type III domain-containing protein [Bacteroidales bacterium]